MVIPICFCILVGLIATCFFAVLSCSVFNKNRTKNKTTSEYFLFNKKRYYKFNPLFFKPCSPRYTQVLKDLRIPWRARPRRQRGGLVNLFGAWSPNRIHFSMIPFLVPGTPYSDSPKASYVELFNPTFMVGLKSC